jgi:hypothetical protein
MVQSHLRTLPLYSAYAVPKIAASQRPLFGLYLKTVDEHHECDRPNECPGRKNE